MHSTAAVGALTFVVLAVALAECGAFANVEPMRRRLHRPAFSPLLHRDRNLVGRFFNKPKHFRAIATRRDKRAGKLPRLFRSPAHAQWPSWTGNPARDDGHDDVSQSA